MDASNQKAQLALEYVLTNILGKRPRQMPMQQTLYCMAFEATRVTDINDFLIIEDEDWKELEFTICVIKWELSENSSIYSTLHNIST